MTATTLLSSQGKKRTLLDQPFESEEARLSWIKSNPRSYLHFHSSWNRKLLREGSKYVTFHPADGHRLVDLDSVKGIIGLPHNKGSQHLLRLDLDFDTRRIDLQARLLKWCAHYTCTLTGWSVSRFSGHAYVLLDLGRGTVPNERTRASIGASLRKLFETRNIELCTPNRPHRVPGSFGYETYHIVRCDGQVESVHVDEYESFFDFYADHTINTIRNPDKMTGLYSFGPPQSLRPMIRATSQSSGRFNSLQEELSHLASSGKVVHSNSLAHCVSACLRWGASEVVSRDLCLPFYTGSIRDFEYEFHQTFSRFSATFQPLAEMTREASDINLHKVDLTNLGKAKKLLAPLYEFLQLEPFVRDSISLVAEGLLYRQEAGIIYAQDTGLSSLSRGMDISKARGRGLSSLQGVPTDFAGKGPLLRCRKVYEGWKQGITRGVLRLLSDSRGRTHHYSDNRNDLGFCRHAIIALPLAFQASHPREALEILQALGPGSMLERPSHVPVILQAQEESIQTLQISEHLPSTYFFVELPRSEIGHGFREVKVENVREIDVSPPKPPPWVGQSQVFQSVSYLE